MLNFLCATAEEDLESIVGIIFGFIVIIIAVFSIIDKVKKQRYNDQAQQQGDGEFLHPNERGQMTAEQSRYVLNTRNKGINKPKTPPTPTVEHHSHLGTTETYDPIVGSLGAVSDEGCDELNGVRLIATDLMYETDDEGKVYDMNVVRKSLILGEILNNPRFKTPYGKK